MKRRIDGHCEAVAKILLSSKKTAEKKAQIESAFRFCKDAFLELYAGVLNSGVGMGADGIRAVVREALEEDRGRESSSVRAGGNDGGGASPPSWVTVAASRPKIRVPRGPTVAVTETTSFFVVPSGEGGDGLASSEDTKKALYGAFRPSDCGLRINKVSFARDNGLRIEAASPDIAKIKAHPAIACAGLKVVESIKLKPRIIVHGVPTEMTAEEIRKEIIAQNLNGDEKADIKLVYIFPGRPGSEYTSCILEIAPTVRSELFKRDRIYLRFSACRYADHVRILQCFKCSNFGHIAKDCKMSPSCGHCSEAHEPRACTAKNAQPKCINCMKGRGTRANVDVSHSAFDASKCPILAKHIRSKISNTNYG